MLGSIVKSFEWSLVRKAQYKCRPFSIYLPLFLSCQVVKSSVLRERGVSDLADEQVLLLLDVCETFIHHCSVTQRPCNQTHLLRAEAKRRDWMKRGFEFHPTCRQASIYFYE